MIDQFICLYVTKNLKEIPNFVNLLFNFFKKIDVIILCVSIIKFTKDITEIIHFQSFC